MAGEDAWAEWTGDDPALADELQRRAKTYGHGDGAVDELIYFHWDRILAALRLAGGDAGGDRQGASADDRAADPRMREPSPGMLMSMAIRYDHGFAVPGYYDQAIFRQAGGHGHAQRLESTLSTMRQLWEEATGNGFYRPEKEAEYVAARDRSLTPGGSDA